MKLLLTSILAFTITILANTVSAQKQSKYGDHTYTVYNTELQKNNNESSLSAGEYTRTYIKVKADSLLVTTEKYGTDNKLKGLDVSAFDITKVKVMGPTKKPYNENLYEVTVTNNGVANVATGYMITKTGFKTPYTSYVTAYLYFKDEAAANTFITSIKK